MGNLAPRSFLKVGAYGPRMYQCTEVDVPKWLCTELALSLHNVNTLYEPNNDINDINRVIYHGKYFVQYHTILFSTD